MKYFLCFILGLISNLLYAQAPHFIESAQLEVKYNVHSGKDADSYILRCGKKPSDYFSYDNYSYDSLSNTGDDTYAMMRITQDLEQMKHPDDDSKRLPESPGHRDYLYRNLVEGKISVYTDISGSHFVYEEDIPAFDWKICPDSTSNIIGYTCLLAKTHFRGRDWSVWYAPDIPVGQGPWKFSGLPGLILQADCKEYMHIEACGLKTKNLSPVKFYNFNNYKYEKIDRVKFLKSKTNPKAYPPKTIMTPQMELE